MNSNVKILENNAQKSFDRTISAIKERYGKEIDLINGLIDQATSKMEFKLNLNCINYDWLNDEVARKLRLYYISQGYNANYYTSNNSLIIFWGMKWQDYTFE